MKKLIILLTVMLSFPAFAGEVGDRQNLYRPRIQALAGITAPPNEVGFCTLRMLQRACDETQNVENIPRNCRGIADVSGVCEKLEEDAADSTEVYGDANSGYMRDGEYVQEWGVLNNFNSEWAQLQYGPYDEIYTVDIVNTNRRRAGAVASIGPSAILFNCQSFYDRDGEKSDCRIKWKVTARKTSEDTSTSDFINGTIIYYISFNVPGTLRQCVAASSVAGRPTHGTCTLTNSSGYVPIPVAGYYVDVATSAPRSFQVKFEKYNFSGNLKTPGTLVSGSDAGAACPNWKNGNFSGCSVSTIDPNACPAGEIRINGSCMDLSNFSI